MKRFVHPKSTVDMLKEFEDRKAELTTSTDIEASDDWIDDEDEGWELLDRKDILDYDGFYTKYSLYVNNLTGTYVTVFGDPDIYRPERGDSDAEFDNEAEAREFFDDYDTGVEEDF